MRPIERGPIPLQDNGTRKSYKSYGSARRDLIDRMGQYCSYCNQKLPSSLAVEHVQPKSVEPQLELEWDNFLLGCTNCNSIKTDNPVNLDNFIWPEIHNTHIALIYLEGGEIEVNPTLSEPLKQRTQNLINLVGLQRYPDNPTASDRRWKNRKETFIKAKEALTLYHEALTKGAERGFERALGLWASDSGFFSIWLQVFSAYPTVKLQIISCFNGTARNAFDDRGNAIARTDEL